MTTLLGQIVADFTTQLASEIAVGGTTATLSSATDDDGVALPSGRYYFTLDGANSNKEHISCTLSGTSLTNIKSVSRQGVETTGVARKHRIGASIGITDFAHIMMMNNLLKGSTSFDYASPLGYDASPTLSNQNHFATKGYADALSIQGAANASSSVLGITKLSADPATNMGSVGVMTSLGTATITIATPGVVSLASHGLVADDIIQFTTTGALPTGITANLNYYVISTGLTGGTFQFSTSLGGAAVNTTGTQSGVHTLSKLATISIGANATINFISHNFEAGDTIYLTTTGALPTGLTPSTTYYVISTGLTANSFRIAATLNGSAITTSGTQSGTHTLFSTVPMSVGDNDGRVPTQSENDALIGQSQSGVSSTNRFEDYNDTAIIRTANRLLRGDASTGYLNDTWIDHASYDNIMTMTAGEALTAGDALHIIDSFAQDGYITTDVATLGSSTTSITIPSTSNRCLFVSVAVQGNVGVACTSVTHNGTAMTLIGQSGGTNNGYGHTSISYIYKLVAPATGTHDVVVTATGLSGVSIYSLSNVDQTTPTEAFGTNPVTPSVKNCKIINSVFYYGVWGGGVTAMSFSDVATTDFLASGYYGSGISERIDTVRSETGGYSIYNTGGSSDGGYSYGQVVVRPSSTTGPAVVKATTTGSKTTFVGFARTSASSGSSVPVRYSGVVTGLTGLAAGTTYYIGSTAGVVASTGTRKVGIGLSSTSLLITNIA